MVILNFMVIMIYCLYSSTRFNMRYFTFLAIIFCCLGCQEQTAQLEENYSKSDISLAILGIAQDAGYPQAGCLKDCCKPFKTGEEKARYATSIAIIDRTTKQTWLFEATPDVKHQLYQLQELSGFDAIVPNGVFLTHAHIGHYTGLIHFGHEVMGAKKLPVFAMPKMSNYLTNNGPWSQLVKFNNIALQPLMADSSVQLSPNIKVTPFLVPHRDEFSETVGYEIQTTNKKILFIPDINKWNIWDRDIVELVKNCDLALLDGTFYENGELPNRDMSQILHPFIEESMNTFANLSDADKQKIMFIHFNHTNPILRNTKEYQEVIDAGYQVAREGMEIEL